MFSSSKILCDYIISLAYQTRIHTHIKQQVKLHVLENSCLSRFTELEVTRLFASYLSPWPTDNQFYCIWNCPWTCSRHCCERLQVAAQTSLPKSRAGDVAAMSRRTAFYGFPYLFTFGLKLVTQRYLDLNVYVHVQSLKITRYPSYIVHKNVHVFAVTEFSYSLIVSG
jgi:hypothetical protein